MDFDRDGRIRKDTRIGCTCTEKQYEIKREHFLDHCVPPFVSG
jgi:hypothetical protein